MEQESLKKRCEQTKPCPFCGTRWPDTGSVCHTVGKNKEIWTFMCERCEASGPAAVYKYGTEDPMLGDKEIVLWDERL
jgi:transcription elongation factor Elf1